jgi:hypothetical protein
LISAVPDDVFLRVDRLEGDGQNGVSKKLVFGFFHKWKKHKRFFTVFLVDSASSLTYNLNTQLAFKRLWLV